MLRYIFFTIIALFYIKVITTLYNCIEVAQNGGFSKTIDKNSSVWYERSLDNMILDFKIWIFIIVLFMILSLLFVVKRPKVSVLILLIPFFSAYAFRYVCSLF